MAGYRKITLSKAGVSSVELSKADTLGSQRITVPRQTIGITGGNDAIVNTHGDPDVYIYVSWNSLQEGDLDNLITFFSDSNVNWKANTFQYTDIYGNQDTVRLWSEEISKVLMDSSKRSPFAFVLRVEG